MPYYLRAPVRAEDPKLFHLIIERAMAKQRTFPEPSLPVIHPHAAGIDIGTEQIFVSVRPGHWQAYESFTGSLYQLRDDLLGCGVTTVAMEATGVLWIPLFEILEAAGIEVYLVNGAHVKNVPGRKSDVMDCQWLQQVHSYGLVRASFIPEDGMRQLRSYVRLRQEHIACGAREVQHMQRALELMNLKLHEVISQIQGESGLRIIRAILDGERDRLHLALLCDRRIRAKKHDRVVASLEGNYRDEHIFALRQALEAWEFFQGQIQRCDEQIEQLLQRLTADLPQPEQVLPPKPMRHHIPAIEDLHGMLMQITGGRDASQLCGMTDHTLMLLIAEVGVDMDQWPTEKHFTSWLGLAPGSHQSGKRRRRRSKRAHTRAGEIFRACAQTIARSKHLAMGSFYRRLKAKRGPGIAMKATARKLAVLYYRMMKFGMAYVEQGVEAYEAAQREQQLKRMTRQASLLGYKLIAA